MIINNTKELKQIKKHINDNLESDTIKIVMSNPKNQYELNIDYDSWGGYYLLSIYDINNKKEILNEYEIKHTDKKLYNTIRNFFNCTKGDIIESDNYNYHIKNREIILNDF